MKNIAFLINGTIKNKNNVINDIEQAFNPQYSVSFYISEYSRHIEKLCMEAIKGENKIIVFVGGDGTLNEGINGLLDYTKKREKHQISSYSFEDLNHIKIGLLPLGSGNDFARTIKITGSISSLKEKIDKDTFQKIDVGFATFVNSKLEKDSRFFINIADVGMGGYVAQNINNSNSILSANFKYMFAIFSAFFHYKKSKVTYSSNNESWESDIMSLAFANGKFFGSGLGIAPDADIQDGILNITKLGNITLFDYFRYLGDIKKLKHIQHSQIAYSKATEFSINSNDDRKLLIDMDGEFVGYSPLNVKCLHQIINFIY